MNFEKTFENERIACFFKKGWDDDIMKITKFDNKNIIRIMRLRDPNEYREYNTMIVVNTRTDTGIFTTTEKT